jgi:hypothetical protein
MLRQSANQPGPVATIDLSKLTLLTLTDKKLVSFQNFASGQSLVITLLDPEKEPSKHILYDFSGYVDYFKAWPGKFVFLAAEDRPQLGKVLDSYQLPKNQVRGFDHKGMVLKALTGLFGEEIKDKLPLVLLVNVDGQVYLFSSGYNIGTGEQLLKLLPVMNKKSIRE